MAINSMCGGNLAPSVSEPRLNEDRGLTLMQAVEQCTDREKWRAWQELCRPPERETKYSYLFAHEGWEIARANDAWRERRARQHAKLQAWRALVSDVTARLCNGELVATGMYCPMRPDSTPCIIRPNLIPYLRPNFEKSSFSGRGIEFIHVQIRRASDLHLTSTAHGQEMPGPASIPSVLATQMEIPVIRPRGSPGRTALPPEYCKELFRRAETGQMLKSLNQEARSLRAWGAGSRLGRPDGEPWAESTIRNHLRVPYRELKTRKTGPE